MPGRKWPIFLLILFSIWVTITTLNAHHPYLAWVKYDITIKTWLFIIFIPFVLDTRLKIECFLWTFAISVSYYLMIFGLKGLVGGGGYGSDLIATTNENSGITESSTLATVAMSMVPVYIYLMNYSLFGQSNRWIRHVLKIIILLCFFSMVATGARTGVVAGAVMVACFMLISKKKFRYMLGVALAFIIALPFVGEEYTDRVSTLRDTSQETSAMGRIVVWRWTFDYARNNLLGGGFYAYLDNDGQLNDYVGEGELFEQTTAKAFHSIVFEVLGEHGFIGLFLYLGILGGTVAMLRHHIKRGKSSSDPWRRQFALHLMISFLALCAGAFFIGIAFEPWIYYFFLLSACLFNDKDKAEKEMPDIKLAQASR